MAYNATRILVVDDDQTHGRFLEEELSQRHCKATWFRDPREALRQFRRNQYQVGILDLKMPSMNGVELFHSLREKDPDIGLIILTGYPSVDSALATLKTGAYDYLKKPYKIDELKTIVFRLLKEKGCFLEDESVINQRIGQRIKAFRLKKDWTIARLAAHAKLSKSLISQVENAKNSASLLSLAKIAQSLNVRLSDLVQDL
jgi:DNA-binding NtrC family response regulator